MYSTFQCSLKSRLRDLRNKGFSDNTAKPTMFAGGIRSSHETCRFVGNVTVKFGATVETKFKLSGFKRR